MKILFSILIPLEFHRGIGAECLAGWLSQSAVADDAYEIILAAPNSFPSGELQKMRQQLRPHDKTLTLPLHHDMDLVATAADQARGATLVFTESHCVPNQRFLANAAEVLRAHPDWAGFSGKSEPITHNLLSEIEAEMYLKDITQNLEQHPWLKVLDQCFVIKKTAYETVGGVERSYGHFAEWVLAGRLHAARLTIGYDASVAVKHYYIGDLEDLVEFAEDFGAGQMRFQINHVGKPEASWFDSPAMWANRYALSRREAFHMLKLTRSRAWLERAIGGKWLECRKLARECKTLHQATQEALTQGSRSSAKKNYLALNEASARWGQLKVFAAEWHAGESIAPQKRSGRWTPFQPGGARTLGFHSATRYDGNDLAWTMPEAAIWLPLGVGEYDITLRWINLPQLAEPSHMQVFLDGQSLPAARLTLERGRAVLPALISKRKGARLALIVPRFVSKDDTRALGLPLKAITWKRRSLAPTAPR